ncbi:unnamed protein product, partial [marine sediment metagenome]
RTTQYADELLDFDRIDWPERVRLLQTNWIGRSEGAEVHFRVDVNSLPTGASSLTEDEARLTVFTTRSDTLWGATFMVLAPEHPLVAKITSPEQKEAVEAYVKQAVRQTEIQREAADNEKSGVFTGGYAINPVNDECIPIWIADYVMMSYGTGAIMAVPAHDERDFEFALKFGLPILPVIDRVDGLTKSFAPTGSMGTGFTRALKSNGIPFEEGEDGLKITIPLYRVERYIELAQEYLQPNYWNEVVGTGWVFIFDDGVVAW